MIMRFQIYVTLSTLNCLSINLLFGLQNTLQRILTFLKQFNFVVLSYIQNSKQIIQLSYISKNSILRVFKSNFDLESKVN